MYTSIRQGEIKARLAFVFCSREPGESAESDLFLKLVADYSIPALSFSYQRFKAAKSAISPNELRLEYDREVMSRLEGFQPDLCVLAGYMLIVGREMCQRYNMINLHPAAPGGPAGTWQEVIWQLIESGARQTGVMMHLVTPELDEGPPVTYCTFPIRGKPFDKHWSKIEKRPLSEIKQKEGENNPLFQLIRQHGLAREFPLITVTIKAFSEGRVKITPEKKIIDADGNPILGYDMTGEINNILKGQGNYNG